jgi:lipoprotein-anchoring transpeptidase ErfK/SrfK
MRVFLVLLAFLALAGCGGDSGAPTSSDVPSAKKVVAKKKVAAQKQEVLQQRARAECAEGEVRPLGTEEQTYAAVVGEAATAYRAPGAGPLGSFGPENVNGVPTVFAVLAERVDERCRPDWYHVQLPLRPNGVTGWVSAEDVALAAVTTRIEVDLSSRRVTLFDRGRQVLTAKAAIGSAQTPTPTGRYYVNQRLVPGDPSGPFGPGAIGISAFSNVLTGWTQGGPIAIHGTNRPELIGGAVSNGCIRVRNEELRQLFDRVRGGTPVVVRA